MPQCWWEDIVWREVFFPHHRKSDPFFEILSRDQDPRMRTFYSPLRVILHPSLRNLTTHIAIMLMRRHCPARSFLPTSPQVWSIVCHSGKRWKFCYEPETQCEQNLYHVASELSWPLKRDIFRHTYFVLNLIVWIKRNVSNNGICALSKIKSPNIMVFKRILGSILHSDKYKRQTRQAKPSIDFLSLM